MIFVRERCEVIGNLGRIDPMNTMSTQTPSMTSNISELKQTLSRLKRVSAEPCLSILIGTHRTHPENAQDPINLKNAMVQAEERLLKEYEKRQVWQLLENLKAAVAEIDHGTNSDGLAVFANSEMAEVVKLPVAVTDRVIIDHDFATRDLIRALQSDVHYYILTLSEHQSRLIEAHRGEVLMEYGARHTFPIENRLYSTHADKRKQAGTEEDLMKEFCNRVDKAMQEVHATNPLPVLLVGEERNVAFFKQVADHPSWYIGHYATSPDNVKARELAEHAHGKIKEVMDKRRAEAVDHLGKAQGANKLLDDVGDIYRAIMEGRGDTLYVEEGHFQPALIEGTKVTLKNEANEPGVMDDIIDELVENVLNFKGHVVFTPTGSLATYNKVCLTVRY